VGDREASAVLVLRHVAIRLMWDFDGLWHSRQRSHRQLADAIRALQNGQDIDFDAVTGPVDFDENGDPTTATYQVWTYGEDGKLEVMRQVEAAQDQGRRCSTRLRSVPWLKRRSVAFAGSSGRSSMPSLYLPRCL
jgi:hypothetical protein